MLKQPLFDGRRWLKLSIAIPAILLGLALPAVVVAMFFVDSPVLRMVSIGMAAACAALIEGQRARLGVALVDRLPTTPLMALADPQRLQQVSALLQEVAGIDTRAALAEPSAHAPALADELQRWALAQWPALPAEGGLARWLDSRR